MNGFKNLLLDVNNTKQAAKNCVKKYRLALSIAIIGLMFVLTAYTQNRAPLSFTLTAASKAVANCLPDLTARVTVSPKEDSRGGDTLGVKVEELSANATFTVFLTELVDFPFGATQGVGDFTTNTAGRGSRRVDSIIEEAFSGTVCDVIQIPKELSPVVFWFADPMTDEFCVPSSDSIPFDGDGEAGVAAKSS